MWKRRIIGSTCIIFGLSVLPVSIWASGIESNAGIALKNHMVTKTAFVGLTVRASVGKIPKNIKFAIPHMKITHSLSQDFSCIRFICSKSKIYSDDESCRNWGHIIGLWWKFTHYIEIQAPLRQKCWTTSKISQFKFENDHDVSFYVGGLSNSTDVKLRNEHVWSFGRFASLHKTVCGFDQSNSGTFKLQRENSNSQSGNSGDGGTPIIRDFYDLPERDKRYVVGGALFCIGILILGAYLAIDWYKKEDDDQT